VQQGVAKVYIPLIALEERRTQLLDDYDQVVAALSAKAGELKRGQLGMILESLSELDLALPTREEVDRNSTFVLGKYLTANKIEVLPYTFEHATNVWTRYFGIMLPFKPTEKRENRRKDIPDAWILEAALDIKKRPGRHCVLIRDGKLEAALKEAAVEVWDDIENLDAEIEAATAVVPIHPAPPPVVLTALGFRRNLASTRNSKRGAAGLVVVVRHRHAGFAVCCPQGSRRCDREAIGLSGKGSAAGYALKE
jgi:hypothetical protein